MSGLRRGASCLIRLAGRQQWPESAASRLATAQPCTGLSDELSQPLSSSKGFLQCFWLQGTLRFYAALPAHQELSMPALSPTMSQGNLASWAVEEGAEIAAGDVLAEIETDKATLTWDMQDDGIVAKLLVKAGTKDIPVGTPMAVLVEEAEHVAAFKDYQAGQSGAESKPDADAQPSSSGQQQPEEGDQQESQPDVERNVRMGPAAQHLLRSSGLKAEDIRPTGPRGILTKGDVLQAIESGAKPSKAQAKQQAPSKPAEKPADKPAVQQSQQQQPQQQQQQQPQQSKEDPKQKPDTKLEAPPPPASSMQGAHTDVPHTQIRRIIASRLLESKQQIPHLYVSRRASMAAVTQLRQDMKQQNMKASVNDFIVRAAALALEQVPEANAMWDAKTGEIKPASSVDVAIAVATDGGLITPIVKQANTKSLQQISSEVRELAGRARANKLKPEEFQGGSFSISNLGMFGVDKFFAIINPPQACIMAVGGTQQVVTMKDGRPHATPHINVALSADNRVYDDAVASAFLEAFCTNLSSPVRMLS